MRYNYLLPNFLKLQFRIDETDIIPLPFQEEA